VISGGPIRGRNAGAAPPATVLALNSGSSSLKFGLYRASRSNIEAILSGTAEAIGKEDGSFRVSAPDGKLLLEERAFFAGQGEAIARIGTLITTTRMPNPAAIGHRVVHGGPKLRRHCVLDTAVLDTLKDAAPFAPLHTPAVLSVIGFVGEHFPGIPQVACFDTAFHSNMPAVAQTLPLPEDLREEGVQRYGFHGLSCESIVHQLKDNQPARLIVAHLGNGASITAIKDGQSIDTSMGLTPTGGVIMSTRSGDLDPGILIYLMREKRWDATALEDLVDQRCGLLGLSGLDSDMRRLHRAARTDERARLTIDMFCYSVSKCIAAMAVSLGGVDMLVFTGGIGENDAAIRSAIGHRLGFIGITLDQKRNQSSTNPINDATSPCSVLTLPSLEDDEIARHTLCCLFATRS
jgi:acetate kinase